MGRCVEVVTRETGLVAEHLLLGQELLWHWRGGEMPPVNVLASLEEVGVEC